MRQFNSCVGTGVDEMQNWRTSIDVLQPQPIKDRKRGGSVNRPSLMWPPNRFYFPFFMTEVLCCHFFKPNLFTSYESKHTQKFKLPLV
jgi:hypothetical protein